MKPKQRRKLADQAFSQGIVGGSNGIGISTDINLDKVPYSSGQLLLGLISSSMEAVEGKPKTHHR